MAQISITKLVIIAVIFVVNIALFSSIRFLQYLLEQEQKKRGMSPDWRQRKSAKIKNKSSAEEKQPSIQSSEPTKPENLHLWSQYPPNAGGSMRTVGIAHWKGASALFRDWDPVISKYDGTADDPDWRALKEHSTFQEWSIEQPPPQLDAAWSLQQAADAGHPTAQFYQGVSLSIGLPFGETNSTMRVLDDWIPSDEQFFQAMMLWRFSAISGNVEAAMALAHRTEAIARDSKDRVDDASSSPSDKKDEVCERSLPYYEAAANGIMDELESYVHSRGKVAPPMDKHVLAKVHLHGGTSSQLDWANKPDESKEALQFLHFKSTGKATDETTVHAAHTLAHLYHHGHRGVPQNLTKALEYYELAGLNGHWESAGQAGTFYFWGMGVEQDLMQAKKFFQIGAPYGFAGCRKRQEDVVAKKRKKKEVFLEDEVEHPCDTYSLNGLGLLYLFGIKDVMEVDLNQAEKLFTLAKEMGNTDAMYNLAMMWLGWKTHFKRVDDLQGDGTSDKPEPEFMADSKKKQQSRPDFSLHISRKSDSGKEDVTYKGPTQSDLSDAMKLLVAAANKGHIQAKHRVAMITANGIRIRTNAMVYDAVKKDCAKARGLYNWIIENASLQRSRRLRRAYKDFTQGDIDSSLRNYLIAAETGSGVAQVNAAFLLERGHCLGLSTVDCAKASVRLWKVAAQKGNSEAYLRIGDFYYYGRLREHQRPIGPFAWVQYVLYPEEHLPKLFSSWGERLQQERLNEGLGIPSSPVSQGEDEAFDQDDVVENDLHMAAHYYQVAVETTVNSRANFNLGFMHEWGVGLKQDFPLAKRHYDLAMTQGTNADLAVLLALRTMKLHELFVKLQSSWKARVHQKRNDDDKSKREKTTMDVILSHFLDGTSLAILILSLLAQRLLNLRAERERQR